MAEKNGLIVREAVAYDAVNITRLLTKAWQEMDAGVVNEAKALAYVTGVLSNAHVVVADLSGRIVGTMACARTRPPWSDMEMARQEWCFVLRSFRTGQVSDQLLASIESFMDRHNLTGVLTPPAELEGISRTMSMRAGYRKIGASFLRIPDVGASELTA